MTRHPQQTRQRRHGAAVVEMALILPVFIMLVFGVIEFGRAMMISQLVTNSARDGARLAILDGSTNQTVSTAVTDFLNQSVGLNPADVTVTITVTAGPGNPDPGNDVSAAQAGDICTVNVSVPFDKVTLTKADYLSGKNLTGFCSMRREQ